ncbi:MAG: PAS domain-containing sensor histidine kinase [Campylobacterales bacterium]|nr:PAS domain-containing sensor histidine kinase [Campylobacterales bacterium]
MLRLSDIKQMRSENITQSDDYPLMDKTDEIKRLLDTFDKYIIASKTNVNGIITYVSRAFEDASGYSREELIGKPHNIVRHQDMPKEIFDGMWKTIQSRNTWSGEIKNRTKDGNFYWIKTTVSPDIDSKNNIVGYKEVCENITSAKAYEELSKTLENRVLQEIIKNNEKTAYMLHQSRLAQMGEMISMIAHQWRQPLASISAISGTLSLDVMMHNYKEEFFQERLNAIGELSQYLSQTINDFRNFFKKDKIVEKANVKDIIESCLHVIDLSLKSKNIDVIIIIDEDIVLESYVNELKQVILNILKNAGDALLEKSTQKATIWLSSYQKESKVYILIEDNAGGVPDEIIDKIFDPYFSTKEAKDGAGLGLYMSKTIIKEHCKGKLEVHNSERGAKFIIELPLNILEC